MDTETRPTLYLIPNLLGETPVTVALPTHASSVVATLSHFLVEEEKSARRLIKLLVPSREIRQLSLRVLNEHTKPEELDELAAPLLAGHSMGIISEAGCPAIADPGSEIVRKAHAVGARVVPLVGPCSMVLALMASGLNGQRWRFLGYLPVESNKRESAIVELERESRRTGETQIVMDTPYRNQKLFAELLAHCHPETEVCVALGLTTPDEFIKTDSVAAWRQNPIEIGKRPCLFLIGNSPRKGR